MFIARVIRLGTFIGRQFVINNRLCDASPVNYGAINLQLQHIYKPISILSINNRLLYHYYSGDGSGSPVVVVGGMLIVIILLTSILLQ